MTTMNASEIHLRPGEKIYKQEGRTGMYQVMLPYLTTTVRMQPHIGESWAEGVAYMKDNYVTACFYERRFDSAAAAVYAAYGRGEVAAWRKEWADVDVELTGFAKSLAHADLSALSMTELKKRYEEVYALDERMWTISIFIDSFDPGFDQREIERISKAYGFTVDEAHTLSTPNDTTFVAVWEQMLLDWKAGMVSTQAIQDAFFWNGTNYSEWAEVDEAYIAAAAEKAHPNTTPPNESAVAAILQRHGLAENPLAFFRLLTLWRDERKRLNHTGLYALMKILREAARRRDIEPGLVNGLLPMQAADFFEGRIDDAQLDAQLHGGVLVDVSSAGDFSYIFGPDAADAWQRIRHDMEAEAGHVSELKGTIASRGKVTGRVMILNDFNDPRAAAFASGDILVTSMTRPEFLPLMKLAAAFITDEGGITSHAAIVAREMKKPCIIGTKIATQVLKDGDMVEVDAEKGLVRKI